MRRDLTDSDQTSSGEPPPSETPLQRLESIDLFSNLLFNRETVYQTFRRASPFRTVAAKDETLGEEERTKSEDQTLGTTGSAEKKADMPLSFGSLLSYLNQPEMAASDSSKYQAKTPRDKARSDAKSKRRDKSRSDTRSKRRTSDGSNTERASKIIKTLSKANTSKRVNGRGASLIDAIIASDDDDSPGEPRLHLPASSLTPPRQIKVDRSSSEDGLTLDLFPTPAPTYNLASDFEISRLKAAHAKELADLQHQLNASEVRARQSKEAKQDADLQRRQFADSNTRIANLAEELEDERNRSSNLSRERQHLRRQLEDAQASLEKGKEHKEQRDTYERLYREQQDVTADVQREKAEQEDLSQRREQELTEQITSLNAQLEVLRREVSQLKDDNATLRDDNATLKDDKATVEDDNLTLEDDNAALQDDIAALKDDITALQDANATLQDANVALQDDPTTPLQPSNPPLRSAQSTQTSSP